MPQRLLEMIMYSIYTLTMIFLHLQQDIIQHILSYNDSIKYRNGKYMNQISKNDARYDLLSKIPPITNAPWYNGFYKVNLKPNHIILYIVQYDHSIIYILLKLSKQLDFWIRK